jgi:ribosome-binding protein aMBF1 (putative translation factor)
MSQSNENLFDHQDWKTIIMKSSVKKEKQPIVKVTKNKRTNINNNNIKIEKKVENDDLKHAKVPDDLRIKIIQTRNSKKITQKQLANNVNLSLNIISEIETGKAIYNHQHINKIKRYLQFK